MSKRQARRDSGGPTRPAWWRPSSPRLEEQPSLWSDEQKRAELERMRQELRELELENMDEDAIDLEVERRMRELRSRSRSINPTQEG